MATRILLVEDNPGDARLVELELGADSGCRVEVAPDLDAATARLAEGVAYDIVLLDLSLPDALGPDSVAEIRARAPGVPLIVLTGADDDEAAREAIARGAEDFLVKGLDGATLRRAIRSAILRHARRGEDPFRRMIEATPDPVSLNDLETGEYVAVNEAWTRFTGIPREEAIGRPAASLGLWADAEELRAFVQALRRDGNVRNFDAHFGARSGIRDGSVSATILSLDGRPRVLSWTRDVTEQRRVERMRRDLVRMLTHDIKNPLTVILGFAEILRDQATTGEDPSEIIDGIDASARQALALAHNFLDADRIDAGALELNRRPTSLNMIVAHVLRHQTARARRRSVELRSELDPAVPTQSLDVPLIDRAIANLVSNAIKFSPSGGVVRVTTRAVPDRVQVEVRDTGPGVTPEQQPRLFERYAPGGGEEDIDSTGLGLFVVRTIVEAHGGRVGVRCPEGGGSSFEVEIPSG